MDEQIAKIKSAGVMVFGIKVPGANIYFREPTVGEKVQLDESDNHPGLSSNIIRSLIIRIEGELTTDQVLANAPICSSIISTIRKEAPFCNIEKTESLFISIAEEMENNLIYRFKTWVAKELNFPEFVYLSDDMTMAEFLRYIRLAEEVSGLDGMFLYAVTGDETKLTDEAKYIMEQRLASAAAQQAPDWQQAGLNQPPRNVGERKQVQEFLRRRDAGQLTPDELTDRTQKPSKKPISNQLEEGIRQASALLAAKMKQEEVLKARGMPIPKFNWQNEDDAAAEL